LKASSRAALRAGRIPKNRAADGGAPICALYYTYRLKPENIKGMEIPPHALCTSKKAPAADSSQETLRFPNPFAT